MARSIEVVVEASTPADVAAAFAHIVPIDLAAIFRGLGPLPAVTGTSGQTGPWDAAGQRRTVHLSDGSTAQEELLIVDAPRFFSYRVAEFTGVLRHLCTDAHGQWWFMATTGGTTIRWSYAFHPRSALVIPALLPVGRLWQRYMSRALATACESVPG